MEKESDFFNVFEIEGGRWDKMHVKEVQLGFTFEPIGGIIDDAMALEKYWASEVFLIFIWRLTQDIISH